MALRSVLPLPLLAAVLFPLVVAGDVPFVVAHKRVSLSRPGPGVERLAVTLDLYNQGSAYPFEHISQLPSKPFCFTQRYQDVKKVLADTFFGPPDVGVYSPSVQNTLYLMAKEVLTRFSDISSVQLRMPNLHFLPSSKEIPGLVKFADDVYMPTDEPHGTIEATLSRANSKL